MFKPLGSVTSGVTGVLLCHQQDPLNFIERLLLGFNENETNCGRHKIHKCVNKNTSPFGFSSVEPKASHDCEKVSVIVETKTSTEWQSP